MTDQNDYKDLAEAYFSGRIAKDDQRKLNDWLRADAAHMQSFREWEKGWASSPAVKATTDQAWAKFRQMQAPKPIIIPLWRRPVMYWAAAAVLLLLLALPLVRLTMSDGNEETSLIAQAPEPTSITLTATAVDNCYLPDSSLVRLAPGAELTYTSGYGISERALRLNGEAYFEVTKNPDCPFTVAASDFVVEVTGTHFTVRADSSDAVASVELHEGAVLVHCPDSTYMLSPGEQLTYNKENTQVRYARQSLGGLLTRLSRRFRRPILFVDSAAMRQLVRFNVRPGQSLDDILEALGDVYPMSVDCQSDTCIVRLK